MAETLGSLCDKLTIVKLKQYHSEAKEKLDSLASQEIQLKEEIEEFILSAMQGIIPLEKLTFNSNKVYAMSDKDIERFKGTIGEVVSKLAEVNCELWHEQEKVYAFESVPAAEKNHFIKQLAKLNLERTSCIDEIDHVLFMSLNNR